MTLECDDVRLLEDYEVLNIYIELKDIVEKEKAHRKDLDEYYREMHERFEQIGREMNRRGYMMPTEKIALKKEEKHG